MNIFAKALILSIVSLFLTSDLSFAQPPPPVVMSEVEIEPSSREIDDTMEGVILDLYSQAMESVGRNPRMNLKVGYLTVLAVLDCESYQLDFGNSLLPEGAVLFIMGEREDDFLFMDNEDLVTYGGETPFWDPGKVTVTILEDKEASDISSFVRSLRVVHSVAAEAYELSPPKTKEELFLKGAEQLSGRLKTYETRQNSVLSLCSSGDSRKASNNKFVGRGYPMTCSLFLIQKDTALSAGHCFRRSSDVKYMDFNVPLSTADGKKKRSLKSDVYRITASSPRPLGERGDDWAVVSLGKNSITKKFPGEVQGGHLWLAASSKPASAIVVGYGEDAISPGSAGRYNQYNYTQQSAQGSINYLPGSLFSKSLFAYTIDTMAGNSGSPVLDPNGCAIAIHTTGDCSSGGGYNYGTPVENVNLRKTIKAYVKDLKKVYVDLP